MIHNMYNFHIFSSYTISLNFRQVEFHKIFTICNNKANKIEAKKKERKKKLKMKHNSHTDAIRIDICRQMIIYICLITNKRIEKHEKKNAENKKSNHIGEMVNGYKCNNVLSIKYIFFLLAVASSCHSDWNTNV